MLPNAECISGNSTSGVPGDDEYSTGAEGVDGAREDCLNLEAVLEARGYDLCTTRDEMMALDGEKAWCSFASSHMSPELDRPLFKDTEPTLAEMTAKAIELLSKNENGFFLMVEGSQQQAWTPPIVEGTLAAEVLHLWRKDDETTTLTF